MKYPSIKDVARKLRLINANVEGGYYVRLQVWSDGQWAIRYGDSQFDYMGCWGVSGIPGCGGRHCQPRRFNSVAVAKYLLGRVKGVWI